MNPEQATAAPAVFLGPSLPLQDAEQLLQADFRPPVRQGDIYRLLQRGRPRAIAIVDGYFQEVPSVWHKEILWALDQGVPVYGAASMGALRAAELERYGMQGVGRIFEAYRDGVYPPFGGEVFEDDDEVAVIHGPAELGFPALSDAMVDLRSSFARAAAEGILDEALRDSLVAAFKERPYRQRSWDALPEVLAALDVAEDTGAALRRWLADGRVEQKREDALALLRHLATVDGDPANGPRPAFVFERTTLWEQFVESSHAQPRHSVSAEESLVLDELRLDPQLYAELRPLAVLRYACLHAGDPAAPSEDERRGALDLLRRRFGLWSRESLSAWAKTNDLDRAGFDRLIDTEALLQRHAEAAGPLLDAFLLDVLRSEGRYEPLARRASDKAAWIEEAESQKPRASETGWLLGWFFEQRLGGSLPDDPQAVSNEFGFATFDEFIEVLGREYHYARDSGEGKGTDPGAEKPQ